MTSPSLEGSDGDAELNPSGFVFHFQRNQKVPYYLRFHVLQAILIDIVLVVVSLAFTVLLAPLGAGFAVRTLSNTVFMAVLVLVVFAIIECLRGRQAEIPSLSEAVRMQLY